MPEQRKFELVSRFKPKGDQPKAIEKLAEGLKKGYDRQTLLGVTGSGKTFTVGNVIAQYGKPTLVIAHNKTLAAQLYHEFKDLFPKNRVEYFISYYDYYQPESYLPATDTYIEKDLSINPKIEQMRLSATEALATRSDVIVVASVSCIYSLGSPEEFKAIALQVSVGDEMPRRKLIDRLIAQQYERNDKELTPGKFRVRGDVIDVVPGYIDDVVRIELDGDKISKITLVDAMNFDTKTNLDYYFLYPAKQFVVSNEARERALVSIKHELEEALPKIKDPLIAHRLQQRVSYDMEMIKEVGYCKGIENYSRHFDGRSPGTRPYCLLDFFPKDFLLVIDECHQTLPQIHGMHNGDFSRKKTLVEYGFRLPSAFDNRPLKFDEFREYMGKTIFVSATPGEYERSISNQIVEQIIRPTGLVDPPVFLRPIKGQIDDLVKEIGLVVKKKCRALVTTLTKRMAEELTEHLAEKGIKIRYLHSEIDTLERTEIIRQLRLGKFDVLVGINLLREGIDIPEVALVAILDADKEGFLRDERSLIQTIGRAARNAESKVILYLDKETDSIKGAVAETERRRKIQSEFNRKNGITPQTIIKPISEPEIEVKDVKHIPKKEVPAMISELECKMKKAADELNFELAIFLRDRIETLRGRI
ncbi:MAG: excinuclease ABC subunit UvrB [Candidatus Thermoplasmatota archaeon]|nr:excinuclease ABC subunit UvrB [Candidatus Thermoplasmatota archaeon]